MNKVLIGFKNYDSKILFTDTKSTLQNYDIKSISDIAIVGRYDKIESNLIALIADEGFIYLYINGLYYLVDNALNYELNRNSKTSQMRVSKNGIINFELEYEYDVESSNIFYSEDPEDSDFGLWISNILDSEERMRIFLESNSDG